MFKRFTKSFIILCVVVCICVMVGLTRTESFYDNYYSMYNSTIPIQKQDVIHWTSFQPVTKIDKADSELSDKPYNEKPHIIAPLYNTSDDIKSAEKYDYIRYHYLDKMRKLNGEREILDMRKFKKY